MKFIPRPHDRRAIAHLMDHPVAALFAGMGLGKTACTLTAFCGLRRLGEAKRMLVVAPKRVSLLSWPNEIAKWDHTQGLRVVSLRTTEGYNKLRAGDGDVFLINYEQLPKFAESYLKKNKVLGFDTVVFDELTAAKSHNSKRINRTRFHLTEDRGIYRRWGLTGTPTPNALWELYGQIRLLDGGKRFGPSFNAFRELHFTATDYMRYNWEPKKGAAEKIQAAISDIVLTIVRDEGSTVPEPRFVDVEVPLPEQARKSYNELSKQLLLLLKDQTEIVALSAAALANKLLQVTGGAVYREDHSVAKIHDAKLEVLKKLYGVKKPCIVVCNYKHEQERILKALPGTVRFQDSQEFLARWDRGEINGIVCDPRTLSHGLNLQAGGHCIIWFSLTWSREVYDQLNARLIRTGQTETVSVIRLISPDTIDDAVAETLRQKAKGQTALMNTLTNYQKLLS